MRNSICFAICLLLVIEQLCFAMGFQVEYVHAEESDVEKDVCLLDYLKKPDPIMEIDANGKQAVFSYDEFGRRTSKHVESEEVVEFEYKNDMLVSEKSNSHVIDYCYVDSVVDALCINGENFNLIYDKNGDVSFLDKDRKHIAKYVYNGSVCEVYSLDGNEWVVNTDVSFVGNVNPIRYGGWYLDVETQFYYVGDGIYYDPINEVYIQNDFHRSVIASGEPAIVQTITDAYTAMMSNPYYGANSYSISESSWNSGGRWYTGIGSIELVARCIYAENTGLDAVGEKEYKNDRTAVAVVILNRMLNSSYPSTAKGVITQANQFSTINKTTSYNDMIQDSAIARRVMNKTNKAWQEATLLSCILYYTTDKTVFRMVMTIPSYITSQLFFYDARAAYNSSDFTCTGGQWKKGTVSLSNVAIAGKGVLTSKTGSTSSSLQYHITRYGYNLFYNR